MQDNNNKTGMIVGIVVALVALGGLIWWMTSTGEDAQDTTDNTQTEQQQPAEEQQNIVELAQATPELSTLVDAVVAADLVDTLSGDGPFTVFAPTNDAFAALPAGTLESLLEPANQSQLQGILTYHVVSGEVFSSDLTDGQVVTTVQGETLTINVSDSGVTITDATGGTASVVIADVDASNGVVHVIDAVLLPQ